MPVADNLLGFGRALRRAGVPVDSSRIALAQQALVWVDWSRRGDVSDALEAVLVSRQSDREVFHQLFARFFQAPVNAGLPWPMALSGADTQGGEVPEAPQRALNIQRAEGVKCNLLLVLPPR